MRDGDKLTYVDMAGANAWPITDATYMLIERTSKNPVRASNVLRFFYWSFLRGDSMATETGYVPLPNTVQARAVGSLRQVRDVNDRPWDFMSRTVKVEPAQLSSTRAIATVPAVKRI